MLWMYIKPILINEKCVIRKIPQLPIYAPFKYLPIIIIRNLNNQRESLKKKIALIFKLGTYKEIFFF